MPLNLVSVGNNIHLSRYNKHKYSFSTSLSGLLFVRDRLECVAMCSQHLLRSKTQPNREMIFIAESARSFSARAQKDGEKAHCEVDEHQRQLRNIK